MRIHNYSKSSFMVFENRSCWLSLCLDNRNGAFFLVDMAAKNICRCFARLVNKKLYLA